MSLPAVQRRLLLETSTHPSGPPRPRGKARAVADDNLSKNDVEIDDSFNTDIEVFLLGQWQQVFEHPPVHRVNPNPGLRAGNGGLGGGQAKQLIYQLTAALNALAQGQQAFACRHLQGAGGQPLGLQGQRCHGRAQLMGHGDALAAACAAHQDTKGFATDINRGQAIDQGGG